MPAKKLYKLLFALIFFCYTASAQNYRQLFAGAYVQAEQTAADLRPMLNKYASTTGEDSKLMEAIIFPELIRYNRLYDVVETGSLMGLYARLGSDYADFSIGKLQMKPTFAVSLERFMLDHRELKWVHQLGFDGVAINDCYENRTARINRLDNDEWQIKYLVAMIKCLKIKHPEIWRNTTAGQKLVLIATAYNCGWDKSMATIKAASSKTYYHLNYWDAAIKYRFATVAWYRYKELI